MRVLVFHNFYRQPGGEDAVFESECALLRSNGVDVRTVECENAGTVAQLVTNSVWSREAFSRTRRLIEEWRPDVAHVHNFWMALSPSVHAACDRAGVPAVQTLHNFRLLCANAMLMRNGRVCEDCIGKLPWRGVVRSCYRDSATASAAVTAMLGFHRRRGTWARVDAFIALSRHAREKFVAGGLPGERVHVKPNFVRDPGEPQEMPSRSQTCLYAGRLSLEKDVMTLLRAWARARLSPEARLVIAGDGPERPALEREARLLGLTEAGVSFRGLVDRASLAELYRHARCVVLPSVWYEGFPMAAAEAFAHARPLIASRIGSLAEIVDDDRNGLLFEPGNAPGLAGGLERLMNSGFDADRMGRAARGDFLRNYSAEANLLLLMNIYAAAITLRGRPLPEAVRSVTLARGVAGRLAS